MRKIISQYISVFTLLGLALFLLFGFVKYQIKNEIFWKDPFAKGGFTDTCELSILELSSDSPLLAAKSHPAIETRTLKLPIRANSPFANKNFPPNVLIRATCEINTEGLDNSSNLWLSLGSVLGRIAVWVDDKLIFESNEKYYFPALPLPRPGLNQRYNMTIVGSTDHLGIFSLGSMIPLVVNESYKNFQNILAVTRYKVHDFAMISVSLSIGLIALFVTMWIFGVRYTDIFWMNCALIANAYRSYLHWDASRIKYVDDALTHATYIALFLGVLGFLRKRISMRSQLIIFIVPLITAVGIQQLPPSIFKNFFLASFYAVVFAFAMILAKRELKFVIGHRNNMIKVTMAICAFAVSCFLATGLLLEFHGFYLWDSIAPLMLLSFGTLFAVDLVMFHRGFKVAMQKADIEKTKRESLEHSIQMGLTMQTLLMPTTETATESSMKIATHFEAIAGMAGDWHFRSKLGSDNYWVAFGDVVGKGPEAAVAATSILSTLRIASEAHHDLASLVTWVDQKIFSMFHGKITSTIAAVSWNANSNTVTIASNGSFGWIHICDKKAQLIVSRGSSLGSGKFDKQSLIITTIEPGDQLISFSDGILDGSRDISKFVAEMNAKLKIKNYTVERLLAKTLKYSQLKPIHDDKTIVVLERMGHS